MWCRRNSLDGEHQRLGLLDSGVGLQLAPVDPPLVLLKVGLLPESVAALAAAKGPLAAEGARDTVPLADAHLVRFERRFVREHLAAADALQRVRDHVSGEGGVLDVAVAAPEVVRVEDAEDVTARLALALDHLLLSGGRGLAVVVAAAAVVVVVVVAGRRRFFRGRCEVVLRRQRKGRRMRRRLLLKVRLILRLLDLFLVCVSEKLLKLDWSVFVVIVVGGDRGGSGGELGGQRRRRRRKGSEQFGV